MSNLNFVVVQQMGMLVFF